MKNVILGLLSLSIISSCVWNGSSNPYKEENFEQISYSTSNFKFQPERIDIGTVYNFQISNRDRSYAKDVHLYIASENTIESFKIYPGSKQTVLVIAEMDWYTFSISNIRQLEIGKDLVRKPTIEMQLSENIENGYLFMDQIVPTGHFPVFNHGFDYSDLNFIFRHRTDPKSDLDVGIISPTENKIAYTGKMAISYDGEVSCNGRECYRYTLGGNGVSNREGFLLVNKQGGHFEYMELDANYHPQFDYYRYELLSISKKSSADWETFVTNQSRKYFQERS